MSLTLAAVGAVVAALLNLTIGPLILVLHYNRTLGIPDKWFLVGSTALLSGVWQVRRVA